MKDNHDVNILPLNPAQEDKNSDIDKVSNLTQPIKKKFPEILEDSSNNVEEPSLDQCANKNTNNLHINNDNLLNAYLKEPKKKEKEPSISQPENINNIQQKNSNKEIQVNINNPSTSSSICKKLTLFSCLTAALLFVIVYYQGAYSEKKASFYECKKEFKYLVKLDLEGQKSPEKESEHLSRCRYLYRNQNKQLFVNNERKTLEKKIIESKIIESKSSKKQVQVKEIGGKADYPYHQDCNGHFEQCCYNELLQQSEYSLQSKSSNDIRLSYYHTFLQSQRDIEEWERTEKKDLVRLKKNQQKIEKLKKHFMSEELAPSKIVTEISDFCNIYTTHIIVLEKLENSLNSSEENFLENLKEIFNGAEKSIFFYNYYDYKKQINMNFNKYQNFCEGNRKLKEAIATLDYIDEIQRKFNMEKEYLNDLLEYVRIVRNTEIKALNNDYSEIKEISARIKKYKSISSYIEIEKLLFEVEVLGSSGVKGFYKILKNHVKRLLILEQKIETEETNSLYKKRKKNKLNALKIKIGEAAYRDAQNILHGTNKIGKEPTIKEIQTIFDLYKKDKDVVQLKDFDRYYDAINFAARYNVFDS